MTYGHANKSTRIIRILELNNVKHQLLGTWSFALWKRTLFGGTNTTPRLPHQIDSLQNKHPIQLRFTPLRRSAGANGWRERGGFFVGVSGVSGPGSLDVVELHVVID